MPDEISHTQLYQQLGVVQGQMVSVQRDVSDIKSAVRSLTESVDQTKGAGRMLVVGLTIGGGAVGAAIMKFASKLMGG